MRNPPVLTKYNKLPPPPPPSRPISPLPSPASYVRTTTTIIITTTITTTTMITTITTGMQEDCLHRGKLIYNGAKETLTP